MEGSARLSLLWSAGFQGTSLAFADDHTLVYGSGNTLTFISRDGSHVRSAPSLGKGIGRISVCVQAGLMAYSEVTLDPKIFVLSYPDLRLVSTLEGGAKLSYSHLEFSRSGNHLLSVSDEPNFKLTVWQTVKGIPMCGTVVGPGVQEVSFNPLNWKQICVVTKEDLTLWTLEQCGPDSLFTSTVVQLPYTSTSVGKVLPARTSQLQPLPMDKSMLDTSRIIYPHPYVDQVNRPKPVVPLAHCWTPTGGIYCGCEGGELFLVDSESGSATVLVSPLAAIAVEEGEGAGLVAGVTDLLGGDGSVARPGGVGGEASGMARLEEEGSRVDLGPNGQPASSVLHAGDISCLALNRRGLYAAGKNGVLYCFELTKELLVQDHWDLGEPVTSLTWSASYDKLALCTQQGAIFLTEPFNLSNLQLVVNYGCGTFVGVDSLPTNPHLCVTCRSNGMVQLWSVADAGLVSTFDLQTTCSCLCVLASCSAVAVGSETGHVLVLSLLKPRKPALVSRLYLYHGPVSHLAHDREARFLVVAGKDSPDVYIIDARPASKFQVLGRLVVKCPVTHLSLGPTDGSSQATPLLAVTTSSDKKEGEALTVCELPCDLLDKTESAYVDSTLLLSDSYVNVARLNVQSEVDAITLIPKKKAIGALAQSRDFALLDLLSEQQQGEVVNFEITVKGHEMKVNGMTPSSNGQLVLSVSKDGKLQIRRSNDMCLMFEVEAHVVHLGGCISASFGTDTSSLLSVGDNGLLLCWNLEFDSRSKRLQDTAIEYAENWKQSHAPLIQEQNKALRSMPPLGDVEGYSSDEDGGGEMVRGMGDGSCGEVAELESSQSHKQESVAPSRATSARVSFRPAQGDGSVDAKDDQIWLEQTKEEVKQSEGDEHTEQKAELRQELQELRSKVLAMIEANETLEDIEKLGRHEFILDTEEHQRLLAAEDQVLQKEREELELANLAQLYLREAFRTQCWDEMMVKGTVLKAFQTHLEVSNYALQKEDPEETRELERVRQLRRLELAESKARSKFVLTSDQAEDLFDEDDEIAAATQVQGEEVTDPHALVGSQAAKYGGASELVYDQFELFSCERMRHQIVLLRDCIRNIKLTFNKEFDEVLKLKEAEIKRIKERNVRIAKIVGDLKLPDEVADPSLDSHEDPEQLLGVDPSEVKVEKYISEEESKRLEEQARLDEEKRAAERADNWRERALDMMMDGRLEINPEEELFKDLPRPDFLSKPAEAMTEEEMKLAKEFEQKEAELLEEREKYKKSLEAELRRLQEASAQGLEGFDNRLKKLFYLKIRTEMAVNQEELKILRLGVALNTEREITDKEEELHARLEKSKNKKIALASVITAARQKVEEMQQAYDMCLAEDKDLDKGFKKEFADCEPHLDQLYKLYRKRPRGQRLRAGEGSMQHDPASSNPFAHRPMSALGGKKLGGDVMVELDHPSNMPEGMDRAAWDHFVKARRRKVDSEQRVKGVALELADMQAYLDKRVKTDEALQQDIQDTFRELNKLRDEKARNMLNLEVQLLLKQGQVEVETGQFVPTFTDGVLIHRKLIEDLNAEIKDLGKGKLGIMKECKEFKKGIHMLEWEHVKAHMEAEDLITKTKDIQNLKVTKELQKRLLEEDQVEKSHQQENEVLERTLALNEKMLHKAVKDKQKTLNKLQQEIKEKKKENAALDQQLRELQVCILERREIEEIAGVPPAEANAEAKMRDIVLRRRMVETAKSQTQEVALLRAELERLRMRTFPALVQVDN